MADITAGERIREFLNASQGMSGIDKETIITRNFSPLLASDLRALLSSHADLYEALKYATEIIRQRVPRDALGENSYGDADVPRGLVSWPVIEEYLHYFDAALAKAEGRS